MAINQLKLAYSIVKEIKGGNSPTEKNYGLTEMQFAHIIADLQDRKGYISGVDAPVENIAGGSECDLSDAYITLDGEQFLKDNSLFAKTYKGLKEVREWINVIKP